MEDGTVKDERPVINFSKIGKLIPEKGSLVLHISKAKGDELLVMYAPKFKINTRTENNNKEEVKELKAPIPLRGTPEELSQHFEKGIFEISQAQNDLAASLSDKAERIKTTGKKKTGKKKDEKEKKTDPPVKKEPSLFSMKQKDGAGGQEKGKADTAETAAA